MSIGKRSAHWKREMAGRLTKADLRHEAKELWGYEAREHGLTMREAERAMLNAQKRKYQHKPRSKFHVPKTRKNYRRR